MNDFLSTSAASLEIEKKKISFDPKRQWHLDMSYHPILDFPSQMSQQKPGYL